MDREERRLSQVISEGSNSANTHNTEGIEPTTTEAKTRGHIPILYTQVLCKSIKKICSKYSIQTNLRGNRTIKNILVPPNGQGPYGEEKWSHVMDPMWRAVHVMRNIKERPPCTFVERFKEHLKDPSPIHHHSNTTSHITTQDNFQIKGREHHGIPRTIRESIYIRVKNPTLNRNIGKYNLHQIWDKVLLHTLGLKINRQGTKYIHLSVILNVPPA